MDMAKKDIRQYNRNDLLEVMIQLGEKPYRALQIYQWIWNRSATSFDEMTNISKTFRSLLKEQFEFRPILPDLQQTSSDGTLKASFRLFDGNLVEGVLIPADHRMTACISSQVGCSLSCAFCATGYLERKRNLSPAEIYDQVIQINRMAEEQYAKPLSNIVFMGMGEPLLNYQNVMQAIEHMISPEGLGISAKRITLSTAGIASGQLHLLLGITCCNRDSLLNLLKNILQQGAGLALAFGGRSKFRFPRYPCGQGRRERSGGSPDPAYCP